MNSHLLSASFAVMLTLILSACSGSGSTTPASPPPPPPSNSAPVVDAGADQKRGGRRDGTAFTYRK